MLQRGCAPGKAMPVVLVTHEVGGGERFVQDHLRAVARARKRRSMGVPAVAVAAGALLWLLWAGRRRTAVEGART